jgi:lipid-A-disaccharide synthase-like uncharacterized protein
MFTGRFVVQWLSSERNKKVTIPISFWILSIAGSLLLLSYAVYRRDIVFMIGQSTGLFIYVRNLQMIRNENKSDDTQDQQGNNSELGTSVVQPAALALPSKAA